jgi:hypothetical protein
MMRADVEVVGSLMTRTEMVHDTLVHLTRWTPLGVDCSQEDRNLVAMSTGGKAAGA